MIYKTPARAQCCHARFDDELIIYSNDMDERVSHRMRAEADELSERTGESGGRRRADHLPKPQLSPAWT
jgi:hypothetical protein